MAAYCYSFLTQFWVSRDLFTELTTEEGVVRTFFQRGNLQQPVQSFL